MNANILHIRIFCCFDNGISHCLPFLCLISTVQNGNTMNSFPRHNWKIITEGKKTCVWKGEGKIEILAREQNRITLLEKSSMKKRTEVKARHTALWILVIVGKCCVSAVKTATKWRYFLSSWQYGKWNAIVDIV